MSRLFTIDDRKELNALYILVLALELGAGTTLSELATAFYLFRNPTLLAELASDEALKSLRSAVPDYEYTNLTSSYRAFSPAILDRAFKSGLQYLLEVHVLRVESSENVYSLDTSLLTVPVQERLTARAHAVGEIIKNSRSDSEMGARVREAIRVKW